MGKALLIMVLGTGLFVSLGYMSTQEALVHTANQQAGYEEEVVAREIARSGFNVAMGITRPYGANLMDAVNAVNGTQGVMKGSHQGGEYHVTARFLDGFTLEISSTGYFGGAWRWDAQQRKYVYEGGARHTMNDRYQIPVLMARRCSVLKVRFLQSQAGYCSAIFLDRYPEGVTATTKPAPEMLFAASHNSDYNDGSGTNHLTVTKYIAPGTQMNFFIGVDQNCSTRPGGATHTNYSLIRNFNVLTEPFVSSRYDYLHYALDLEVDELQNMEESVWGLVEEHPTNNQRWRIGWEDIHNTSWNNPAITQPRNGLQALKRFGYDLNNDGVGEGWNVRDAYGYRKLHDGQLDLSDQVVEVWLEPASPENSGGVCPVYTTSGSGGGGIDIGIDIPGGGTGTGTGTGGGTTNPPPTPCGCPQGNNDKKVQVRHYPPGNRSNPQDICIARSGWTNGHDDHAGDYIICEGQ